MTVKLSAHDPCLASRRQAVQRWQVPAVVKQEVLRFVDGLALGQVNPGKRISEGRQAKYLDSLRVSLEFIGKPTGRLALKDVERFERALSTNGILSHQRGAPYADSTKVDLRKALKVFLRWRLGKTKATELAGWLDTRDHYKTPDYLSEAEVEALFKQCRTPEQRYIVAVLFDAGARAEEFLNLRFEDMRLPESKENYVKLTLKEEYSKTLGRTISLYWRHTLEAVQDYLTERLRSGPEPIDPILPTTYDGVRLFLRRLGLKTLNRPVHPHLFRHSSATHYAAKLNRQELCYRYGWRFSSNMPDVYISRAGMESKDLDLKFTGTEVAGLKQELASVRQEARIKEERIGALQQDLEAMKQHLAMIAEVLAANPKAEAVEAALRRKSQTSTRTP